MNAVFIKVVSMGISASWMILAVLALRLALKKAPKWIPVLLWGLVAVKLICPLAVESPFSMIPDSLGTGELVSEWMDDYFGDNDFHHSVTVSYGAAIRAGRTPIYNGEDGYYVVTKHDQLDEPSTVKNTVVPFLAVVWVTGMAVLALYAMISYWRLHRKMDTAIIYKDNIFLSEHVTVPFVLGIIIPRIYLPFHLSDQYLQWVVAHEHSHIRRKDHWWKLLGFLLLTVYWFHPLVWLAYALLCRDIEFACDENVIKGLDHMQRAEYTQALLDCSRGHSRMGTCPLAFGEVGVKGRIRAVMNYRKPAFWIVILAVVLCGAAVIGFFADPKETSIYDVVSQNGYVVLAQEKADLTLFISKEKLPDEIYTSEGHVFHEDEMIVFRGEGTTIYLDRIMRSHESEELLYFMFDCSFDLENYGSVFSPLEYVDGANGGTSWGLNLSSKDLRDETTSYPDALSVRGHGSGTKFAFYVSKEACEAAEGIMMIDIVCDKLSYAKEGYEDHAAVE